MNASPPPPAPAADPPPPRPRRRRVRRRWLRWPVYGLLAVLLTGFGLLRWLGTPAGNARLTRLVEARLAEALGSPVEVGRLELSFSPLALEATEVVIPGAEPGAQPFVRLPLLRIDGRLTGSWRKPGLAIEQIYLDAPEVFVEFGPEGRTNLPRWRRGGGERRGFELRLGNVIVERGVVRYHQQELPLDLTARSVFVRLQGVAAAGPPELVGAVTAEDVVLTLPRAQPYPLAVSAKIRLLPDHLEVVEARASAPALVAGARGTLHWGQGASRFALALQADGELAVLENLGYLKPATDGGVEVTGAWRFAGQLDGSGGNRWRLAGELASVGELGLAGRAVTEVNGPVVVTPEAVRYELTSGRYGGGEVRGSVTVALRGQEHPVELALEVAGVSLPALAADQGLVLPPALGGALSGPVSYRFLPAEPLAGSGQAALTLTPGAGASGEGQVDFAGQVPLTIDDGRLTAAPSVLVSASGAQTVTASGRYDLRASTGAFDYQLDSTDLGEVGLLLRALLGLPGEAPPAWLPQRGRGRVVGVLELAGAQVATRADLDLTAVVSPGAVAERVFGRFALDRQGLRELELTATAAGGARVEVRGSLPFEPGPAAPPFALVVLPEGWPADERLSAWVPLPVALDGRLAGRVELGGSREAPSGRADLTLAPAAVAGFALDRLRCDLRFDPQRLTTEACEASTPAGSVRARGGVDLARRRLDLTFETLGLRLDRAPWAGWTGGALAGVVRGSGQIGGSFDRPTVVADLTAEGLTLGGRALGDGGDGLGRLAARWDGEQVELQGAVPGLVAVSGGGALSFENAAITLAIENLQLGRLLTAVVGDSPASAGPPLDFAGTLNGTLSVTGSLREPRVSLTAPEVVVSGYGRTLRSLEPVELVLVDGAVQVRSLYLGETATGSDFFTRGTIDLGGDHALDLRLQSSVTASWFQPFLPAGLSLEGAVDVLAAVRGTLTAPAIDGQAELSRGTLRTQAFPQSLEGVNAVVLVDPRRVVLDQLSARVGGGRLRANGAADLPQALGSTVAKALEYQLDTTFEGVEVRWPDGFWFRGNGALSLQSTPDGRAIRGEVQLDRAYYLADFDLGLTDIVRAALTRQREVIADVDPLLASTQLAIEVRSEDGVRVSNNVADLRGAAELAVRGSLARPALFGTLDFVPGGTLTYTDNEFELRQGRLTFSNATRLDPRVDFEAVTRAREWDITLRLTGEASKLQVGFSSDPPLPDLDILALLTVGIEPSDSGSVAQVPPDASAAGQFLAGQAANALAGRVGSLFGFDRFRISPAESQGGGSLSDLGVTVGKRLSKDVFVTYTERPGSTEGRLVQVEWQVDDHLTLVLTGRGNETYALDAVWQTRF